MEIVTKSELAERLGISAPRVSQYVTQGMPVLADGGIDLARALKWAGATIDGPAGERARALLKELEAQDKGNPVYPAVNAALGCLFAQIPAIAAQAAREAGAPAEVVAKVPELAHRLASDRADNVMTHMLGMTPRDWPELELCLKLAGVVQ